MENEVCDVEVRAIGKSAGVVEARVNNRSMRFVVDSGSDVTIVRGEEFVGELGETNIRLRSVTGSDLKVRGTAVVELEVGGNQESCKVFIVDGMEL